MLVQINPTPVGTYVIEGWGRENAIAHWNNEQAILLLEAIVNKTQPANFNFFDLYSLFDRGLIEIKLVATITEEDVLWLTVKDCELFQKC